MTGGYCGPSSMRIFAFTSCWTFIKQLKETKAVYCSASPHSLSLPVTFLHSYFINCVPHDSYEFLQTWNLKITMVFCTMGDRGVSRLVSVLLSSASLSLSLPLSLTKQICRFMPLCSLQGGGRRRDGGNYGLFSGMYPPGLIFEIKGVFLSLHAATQQR